MMHNLMQRGFSTRAAPMQMEKTLASTIRGGAIPSRYKTMKNPVASTPEVIHEGMAHWADHCTTCQVTRDFRLRAAQDLNKVANTNLLVANEIQYPEPSVIPESLEEPFHVEGLLHCHIFTYTP